MNNFQEELIEIQTRLAFQEDTIVQLNDVITKQDAVLLQLQQQVRFLLKRVDDLQFTQPQDEGGASQERPPHY